MSRDDYAVPDKAPEKPPSRRKRPALTDGDVLHNITLPANIDAEKTILGAVFMDEDYIFEAIERLQPEDFSLDSHKRIFACMLSLSREREAIDIVTVSNDLSKKKEIEYIGGVAYLASLSEGLPMRPQIDDYIRIVKDKAMARRLIHVCSKTITQASDQSEPSLITASALSAGLEEVISGSVHRRLVPVDEATIEVLNDFEKQAQLTETPGFSWGVEGLDEATGGIQPGEQAVVGCYSGVGKTTLLAQIVAANCLKGRKIALFLIEPTKKTFLRQLYAVLHGIRYTACTKPWLATSHEKQQFRDAARFVANEWAKSLFLFDERNLTLDEEIAHGRLAMHRHGVELIGIDYIQRMQVPATDKNEDMRLRMGRASIANAELVKDTGARTLVLSQLNRGGNLESVPTMNMLRECVHGDTRVIDAVSGRLWKVADLEAGAMIMAVDDCQHVRPAKVSKVWSTGVKPVWKVKTSTGKTITCTANHPLRSATGWKTVKELQTGDCIASAMYIPEAKEPEDNHYDLCRLLGYLTGDGSYLRSRSVSFISNDTETFDDVEEIMLNYWPSISVHRKKSSRYHEASFTMAGNVSKNNGNPVRVFLQEIGVYGQRDSEKHIPEYVWARGREGARQFLAGYLATDGCVKKEKYNSGLTGWRVHFDSTSYRLARDIQTLLQRLGIVSSISNGYTSKKATKPLYRVYLSSYKPNLLWFASTIPVRGRKAELLASAAAWCDNTKTITNSGPFGLPREISRYASIRYAGLWKDQGKMMDRERAAALACKFSDQWLLSYAKSDLLWEKVVAIEPAGEAEVYDLTVPETGAFLADGLVAHNSGQLENDATTICLLHLKWDSDLGHFTDEGAGIICKQRFGVPCNVKLFKDSKTAKWCSGDRPEGEVAYEQPKLY